MKLTTRRSNRHQRGAAAIEAAIILPIFVIVLVPLVLWAQYMWHYTIVHRAAQDAAQFMATVPKVEMNSKILAGRVKAVAMEIVRRELSDIAGEDPPDEPAAVLCDDIPCGQENKIPTTVTIEINFEFNDRVFNTYLGPRGINIESRVTMDYVGT